MEVPFGRVTRLQYRDAQPKLTTEASVLVVSFRAPDGDIYHHELDNRHWLVNNPSLQLMALNNFKPSDIEGTCMNVEEWMWMLPLTYNNGYVLSQMALRGGEDALREATWFDADDGEILESGDEGPQNGGGDTDPSGGSSRSDEESADESAVTVRVADEESNSGLIFDATSS